MVKLCKDVVMHDGDERRKGDDNRWSDTEALCGVGQTRDSRLGAPELGPCRAVIRRNVKNAKTSISSSRLLSSHLLIISTFPIVASAFLRCEASASERG